MQELRPMSVPGILDATFQLYRDRFATFVTIALVVYVPIAVVSAIAMPCAVAPFGIGGPPAQSARQRGTDADRQLGHNCLCHCIPSAVYGGDGAQHFCRLPWRELVGHRQLSARVSTARTADRHKYLGWPHRWIRVHPLCSARRDFSFLVLRCGARRDLGRLTRDRSHGAVERTCVGKSGKSRVDCRLGPHLGFLNLFDPASSIRVCPRPRLAETVLSKPFACVHFAHPASPTGPALLRHADTQRGVRLADAGLRLTATNDGMIGYCGILVLAALASSGEPVTNLSRERGIDFGRVGRRLSRPRPHRRPRRARAA